MKPNAKHLYKQLEAKLDLTKIPGWIITSNLKPHSDFLDFCIKNKMPVFTSQLSSGKLQYELQYIIDQWFAPYCKIHGTLVDVYGVGILYIGKSRIGKSECALDLVERGHSLIADDSVHIVKKRSTVVGFKNDTLNYHMEIRGIGIIDIQALFGTRAVKPSKRIDVIVELENWNQETNFDRTGLDVECVSILKTNIDKKLIPVTPGKNLTVISEVIAMDWLLKKTGVSMSKNFNQNFKKKLNTNSHK